MLKRIMAILLSATIGLTAAACSGAKESPTKDGTSTGSVKEDASKTDPLYKYPEKVTMTIGLYRPGAVWDMANNPLTQLIEDQLNIKIEAAWDLPWAEHVEKVKLAVATNSLPDACVVYDYNLVKQLAEAGTIADLTETQKLFGSFLKKSYESFPNNSCLNEVTFNGKLYAIPSTGLNGQHELLWIRKDWLDSLGLQVPKTLEDVMKVAEAFVKQDPDKNSKNDTIGIPFNRWIFGGENATASLDPFFAVYDAFPRMFFKDSNGKVIYGSIQNEMKTALGKAAEYYKAGLLYVSGGDGSSKITSGKCGMVFAPWWAGAGVLSGSHESNPNIEWIPVSAPLNSNGKYVTTSIPPTLQSGGYVVVRSGYEHPEAAARVINLYYGLSHEQNPDLIEKYTGEKDKLPGFGEAPLNIQIGSQDVIHENYLKLKDAIESGNTDKLNEGEKKAYEAIKLWQEDPSALDHDQWMTAMNLWVGAPAAFPDVLEFKDPCIPYQTPTMVEKFTSLKEYEDAVFHGIIVGEEPLDKFDNYVNDWKNMGGDALLQEIEEYLKAK